MSLQFLLTHLQYILMILWRLNRLLEHWKCEVAWEWANSSHWRPHHVHFPRNYLRYYPENIPRPSNASSERSTVTLYGSLPNIWLLESGHSFHKIKREFESGDLQNKWPAHWDWLLLNNFGRSAKSLALNEIETTIGNLHWCLNADTKIGRLYRHADPKPIAR